MRRGSSSGGWGAGFVWFLEPVTDGIPDMPSVEDAGDGGRVEEHPLMMGRWIGCRHGWGFLFLLEGGHSESLVVAEDEQLENSSSSVLDSAG